MVPISINRYGATYYRSADGRLVRLIGKGFKDVAMDDIFIIGIYIDQSQNIHAIYDFKKRQIFLSLPDYFHIRRIPQTYQALLHSPSPEHNSRLR